MTDTPVARWDTDFDVLSPEYVADPYRIWDELREVCPIAHTDRRGSTWLPTRYQDVVDLAHDVEHFSSTEISVIPFRGNRRPSRSCCTDSHPSRPTHPSTRGPVGSCFPGSHTPGWRATNR